MQTKKEDMRQDILNAATKEFLAKGYSNTSIRSIANRAHTTVGNIYNYFPKKEALLDEVIGPIPVLLRNTVLEHGNIDSILEITDVENIEIIKNNLEKYIDIILNKMFSPDLLFSEVFIIFVEGCTGTKYEPIKEEIINLFAEHISTHLNLTPEHNLSGLFANNCIQSIIMIAKSKKDIEAKLADFKTYILTFAFGFPSSSWEMPSPDL